MHVRRHFGSTGVLFMGVLVALAALGVVYGLWSKNLLINGTVQTGDLNADWVRIITNDPGEELDPCLEGNPTGCPAPEKHVGWCEAAIGDPTGQWGDQVATIKIGNAYPSYECLIEAWVLNTGTIPFNMIGFATDVPRPLELLPIPGVDTVCLLEGADPTGIDPRQVDPGDVGRLVCRVHVMQEAEQSNIVTGDVVEYEFQLKVCVAQWNEEATFDECVSSPQHEGPPWDSNGTPP